MLDMDLDIKIVPVHQLFHRINQSFDLLMALHEVRGPTVSSSGDLEYLEEVSCHPKTTNVPSGGSSGISQGSPVMFHSLENIIVLSV